jgi:hypothetical protein
MKYLFTLIFLSLLAQAKCQTYNYYNIDGQGSWRSITILIPPGAAPADKAVMTFFNSSASDKIEPLVTIKQMKQDTITASYATIGPSTEQYIIIAPASKKYIIMSDSRQLFKTIYMLDGPLFNPLGPAIKKPQPINTDNVNRLLKVAVKILQ